MFLSADLSIALNGIEFQAPPRSDLFFRSMLDNLPAGAYTCDADGLITYYNAEALRVWGRAPALNDELDRFCGSFKLFEADGSELDHQNCWMGLALRDEKPYVDEEIIVERPNGERRTVLAHATPIHDEAGRLLGAVNVLVDITDRKRAELAAVDANQSLEEKVEQRTAELQDVNEELESFNYSVSHDLRAPLRAISGFSQALLSEYDEVLDERARHYLSRIDRGSLRMSLLIDSLLQLSRLLRVDVKHQELNLGELVRELVDEMRYREGDRDVDLVLPDNVVIRGDLELLKVALSNLLANALKFTSDRELARVEVGVEERSGDTLYFVRDNGVGFDMAYADKLFQPFQRLHAADEFDGTGIGLATVRRIIKRHGGRIWAQSTPGAGATFYFTLGSS